MCVCVSMCAPVRRLNMLYLKLMQEEAFEISGDKKKWGRLPGRLVSAQQLDRAAGEKRSVWLFPVRQTSGNAILPVWPFFFLGILIHHVSNYMIFGCGLCVCNLCVSCSMCSCCCCYCCYKSQLQSSLYSRTNCVGDAALLTLYL